MDFFCFNRSLHTRGPKDTITKAPIAILIRPNRDIEDCGFGVERAFATIISPGLPLYRRRV